MSTKLTDLKHKKTNNTRFLKILLKVINKLIIDYYIRIFFYEQSAHRIRNRIIICLRLNLFLQLGELPTFRLKQSYIILPHLAQVIRRIDFRFG